jgi:hypothetical protein
MPSDIQAILFDNEIWTLSKAKRWINYHKFRPIKYPHLTKRKIRFRLKDPIQFNRLRIKKIGDGIELIIGFY